MTVLRQIDPPPAEDASRHCANCGYDLRGITEPRCPECGVAFDPAGPAVANVPWFHRRTIGNAAALWRTTWLVTFQTHRLIDAARRNSAADFREAAAFRLICVGIAAGSMALSVVLLLNRLPVPEPVAFATALLPLLTFFHMATMLMDASALEQWPSRASRFATLHDFTAAPLLFLPLGTVAVATCRLTASPPTLGVLVTLAILFWWLICTLHYQRGASGRGVASLIARLILSVVVWVVCTWCIFLLMLFLVALSDRLIDW